MKQIWAPWRIEYVQMEKPEGCILCEKPGQDNDAVNYITVRRRRKVTVHSLIPVIVTQAVALAFPDSPRRCVR